MRNTPLRSRLIRLAHANPTLRPHLLPLLREAAAKNPEGQPPVEDSHKKVVTRIFDQMSKDIGAAKYTPAEKDSLEKAVARMSAAGVKFSAADLDELIAGDEDGKYRKKDGAKDFLRVLRKVYEKSVD